LDSPQLALLQMPSVKADGEEVRPRHGEEAREEGRAGVSSKF